MKGEDAIAALVEGARGYIASLASERRGVETVLARMDAFDLDASAVALPQPKEAPACAWLEPVVQSAEPLSMPLTKVVAARPWLHWIGYNAYGPAIGPRFPSRHAFAGLIGEYRMIPADDFAFGLFLIAPNTFYRDHRHPAPELYVPLTGPTRWRFEHGEWQTRQAGEPVWNDPNVVHATLVGDVPFLCFYAWTRDIALPAEVVPAEDWDTIEARL